MDFTAIFQAFYSLYRGDSDVPASTDDEYTVGMRLANEAINRWQNFDNTFWKELYTTNQLDGTGTQTITTGQTSYTVSSNFKEAGGLVKILDTSGNALETYKIIDPSEVQFQGDNSKYAYFLGNAVDGITLNLNPAPTSNLNGLDLDYTYYKTPTLFTTGSDVTEMSNPYYIVHRMLAQQFRVSRNPYYSSALRDSEDALKIMKMTNDSGSWSNPPVMIDNSGMGWGM